VQQLLQIGEKQDHRTIASGRLAALMAANCAPESPAMFNMMFKRGATAPQRRGRPPKDCDHTNRNKQKQTAASVKKPSNVV